MNNTNKPKTQRTTICRSKLEKDLQADDILPYLKKKGGHWIKLCASSFQKHGEPDIVGCYNGKFYAFELKRDKTARASSLQKLKLEIIKQNGGIAMIIDNLNQLKALFGDEKE